MSYAGPQEQSDNSHAATIRRLGGEVNAAILAAAQEGKSVHFTTEEKSGPLTTYRTIAEWQADDNQAATFQQLGGALNMAILAAERDGLSANFTTEEKTGPRTTYRIISQWRFNRAKLGNFVENP